MKKIILVLLIMLAANEIYAEKKISHKPILDFKVNSYLDGNAFTDTWSMNLRLGYEFKFYYLKLQLYGEFNPYFNWQDTRFAIKKTYVMGGRFYISNFYIQFEHTISESIDKKLNEFTETPYTSYHYFNQFDYNKTTLSIGFKI